MKKYSDFLRISMSKEELYNYASGVGYKDDEIKKLSLYSKIVVQFNKESDFDLFIDNDPDVNMFVFYHFSKDEKLQYILLAIDENAFDDICNICSVYDCDVYQFIIE